MKEVKEGGGEGERGVGGLIWLLRHHDPEGSEDIPSHLTPDLHAALAPQENFNDNTQCEMDDQEPSRATHGKRGLVRNFTVDCEQYLL